jgi:uncharacterized protein YkwD
MAFIDLEETMTRRVLKSTRLRRLRSWIGLLALVAIAVAPGTAHAVNVAPQGMPTNPFPALQCPYGMFMLGVALHENPNRSINAIRANCVAFNSSTGQFVAPPQFTAFSSGAPGALLQNGCTPDRYVSGMHIGLRFATPGLPTGLTYVLLTCSAVSGNGSAVTVCVSAGVGCSKPASIGLIPGVGTTFTIACPGGQAAIGLIGTFSGAVTSLGLICGPKPFNLVVPPIPSVSLPATGGQMVPGQVLAKNGCTTAATVAPTQGDNDSPTAEGIIVCLINAERKARNLSVLSVDPSLMSETIAEGQAAVTQKWWANANSSSHVNPQTGSTPDSRIMNSGYCGGSNNVNYRGEITYDGAGTGNYCDDQNPCHQTNIPCLNGCGPPTAAVDWWMNISPPHRAVILTPNFTHIGVVAIGDMADPKSSSFPAKGLYIVDFGSCH